MGSTTNLGNGGEVGWSCACRAGGAALGMGTDEDDGPEPIPTTGTLNATPAAEALGPPAIGAVTTPGELGRADGRIAGALPNGLTTATAAGTPPVD